MTRLTAVLALTAIAAPALADDLTPPPWRFTPGSTVQHWDFTAGNVVTSPPDALPLFNSFGTPIFQPSSGAIYTASAAGRNNIWAIAGGPITFDIPNTGNQNNMKNLWLQVTYLSIAAVPPPTYSVASINGPFTFVSSTITPVGNGWVHELTQWTTPVCPPFERIAIFPGLAGAQVLIDQVVIDTQCIPIPSPASASLLACAGLIALRRRRA